MPVEFERISANELKRLPRAQTVFFFPVGPLEDHGPHLPLGMDLAEARQACLLAATKLETDLPGWRGVLMPAAPLGLETHTSAIAIRVRGHVLRDWLIDACRSLTRAGFFHYVCFSGQLGPKQLTAIEDASRIISRRPLRAWFRAPTLLNPSPTLLSASSALTSIQDMKRSPFWPDPIEHGGRRDTSIALAIGDSMVDPSFTTILPQQRPDGFFSRFWLRVRGNLAGFWGNPSQATAEQGANLMIGEISDLFPKFRAVWEGAHPNHLFRSWYSILPPNKSFAKGWLMVFILTLLLSFWFYLYTDGWNF